jgi:hypothetical protein
MLSQFLRVAAVGLLLAACNSDTPVAPGPTPAPPVPQPPPALQVGTFDLTQADGQTLPAYIAHRTVDGVLEQVYVDSARLVVQDDGRFEQRIWMRNFRNSAFSHRETWVDAGTWRRNGNAYDFASVSGSRALTVRTATSPVLQVTERMAAWPGAGLVVGVYSRRTTPPAEPQQPPTAGETRFRATDVRGSPLSAIVVTERHVPHENAETFSQLDSAWVVLRTDGTYERRAFYSTWYTPNFVLSLGYARVGVLRDYDRGTYTRAANGTLTLTSSYFQNRTATGVHLGDRIRLTQDMLAGDPNKPDVGYTVQGGP